MNQRRCSGKCSLVLFSVLLLCLISSDWPYADLKILVDLLENGSSDVGVLDAETETVENLTNTPNIGEIGLDWSPDSRQILFLSAARGRADQLEVMNADGTDRRVLEFVDEWRGADWSPSDITLLALSMTKGNNADIYTVRLDGSGLQRLTDHPAEDISPVWSPDGRRIAFRSNREQGWELYVMDADGQNLTQLTHNLGDVVRPRWSPDGRRLAFLWKRQNVWQLHVVDADGSNLIQLTRESGEVDSLFAWSPGGHQIAFSRIGRLFVVDANIGGKAKAVVVPEELQTQVNPYWLPDGKILFHSRAIVDGVWVFAIVTIDVKENQGDVKGDNVVFLSKEALGSERVRNVRAWFDPAYAWPVQPRGKILMLLGQVKAATLGQNYPNPFNPDTWIPFELSVDGSVTIQIHDVQGHLVRILGLGSRKAGVYLLLSQAAYWDGRDQTGQSVASGVYFYTLHVGQFSETRRMVVLK